MLHSLPSKNKKGARRLRELIDERAQGGPIPESVLETRLWKPLARLGVPQPMRQYPVDNGRYRIDFAFPHAMVAVEAQSYRWHANRRAWERDIAKSNHLTRLGWTVIYLTWSDIRGDLTRSIEHLRELLLPRFL